MGDVGDFLSGAFDATLAPVKGLFSGDPVSTAESLFAPSTEVSATPGIVGDVSRIADTAVAGFFGGPPGAAGAAALDNATEGGNIGSVLESGAIAGVGSYAGSQATGLLSGAGAAAGGGASAGGGLAPGGAVDLTSGADLGTIPSASDIGANLGLSTTAGNLTGDLGSTSLGATAGDLGSASAGATTGDTFGGLSGLTSPSSIGQGLSLGSPSAGGGLTAGGPGTAGTGLTPTANIAGSSTGGSGAGAASPFNYDASTTGKILNSLGITTAGEDPGIVAGAVAKNPSAVLGAAGLGYNLLKGSSVPDQGKLETQAQQFSTQGKELASYLSSGQLPAGAQAALQQATAAAKATARSNFASMGLSGSQQEAQALQQIDLQASTQQFSIADKLLTQGLDESKLSSSIYSDLLKVNEQQTKDTGSAIANFAASLGGFQTPKVAGG